MEFAITHRFSGSVLFSAITESLKLCVEAAIKSSADLQGADLQGADLRGAYLRDADLRDANLRDANLRGADLQGADLRGADLQGADLRGAYLRDADLRDADLQGADLQGADLRGAYLRDADLRDADLRDADLQGADLQGADLQGADLRDADLRDADLRDANLRGADLQGADLRGADLRGAYGVNKYRCTPLTLLLDQPGEIRAYKLVTPDFVGPYKGGLKYEIGKRVSVENANTDDAVHCAAGINVSTLDWCMQEWKEGYHILIVEFKAADIACIPIATDGKFRLHRCKVVGEKDLREIGLTE